MTPTGICKVHQERTQNEKKLVWASAAPSIIPCCCCLAPMQQIYLKSTKVLERFYGKHWAQNNKSQCVWNVACVSAHKKMVIIKFNRLIPRLRCRANDITLMVGCCHGPAKEWRKFVSIWQPRIPMSQWDTKVIVVKAIVVGDWWSMLTAVMEPARVSGRGWEEAKGWSGQ